jgi:hypothetical protein
VSFWTSTTIESRLRIGEILTQALITLAEYKMFLLEHAMPLSAVFGLLCGLLIARKRLAFALTCCVPVLAILASLLYNEYVIPYTGGGASMWPIALVVCAVPAVACGCLGWAVAQFITRAGKAG